MLMRRQIQPLLMEMALLVNSSITSGSTERIKFSLLRIKNFPAVPGVEAVEKL